jgi:hypothetical protein
MARYATDNDDEGDSSDPWCLTMLWANSVLEHDPELTPQAPSFVTITYGDESHIKGVVKKFLRAVRKHDDKALLATLSKKFVEALEEDGITALAATIATMNPLFTEVPEQLYVYAYDITEFGISVTLCAVFDERGWDQVIFCMYPDHKRDWKIQYFPPSNIDDEDLDEEDAIENPKISD